MFVRVCTDIVLFAEKGVGTVSGFFESIARRWRMLVYKSRPRLGGRLDMIIIYFEIEALSFVCVLVVLCY
jgi:hypothetical protein